METQLRLNRCVGLSALALRRHLNLIENTNHAIHATRIAIRAAEVSLQFGAVPALRQAISVIVTAQEGSLAAWKVRQAVWLAREGCGKWGDLPAPLPDLQFRRGVPDDAGLQPLEWVGEKPHEFKIQVYHRPRVAVAKVEVEARSALLPDAWHAEWTGLF